MTRWAAVSAHPFEPCHAADEGDVPGHNFTCALLCVTCGLPAEKHGEKHVEKASTIRTRCALCKRIEHVVLASFVEQAGPEANPADPDEAVQITAAICDDCFITHWARRLA